MARTHYHVLYGMPGYMPDDNSMCTSKRQAEAEAASLARQCREDGLCARGSARDGYYAVSDPQRPHYDAYIEIIECNEDDCNEDGELWNE